MIWSTRVVHIGKWALIFAALCFEQFALGVVLVRNGCELNLNVLLGPLIVGLQIRGIFA